MRLARNAAVLVAVLLLCCRAAGAGGPLRPFEHGLWSGGAYIDEHSGAFTHCSAGVTYANGMNLFVLVTGSYRWWLGFFEPKWRLPTRNSRAVVQLRLDDGPPLERIANVASGQLLFVPLSDGPQLITAFRRTSKLNLIVEGLPVFFKLNAISTVMDQLTDCVGASVSLAARRGPATSESNASRRSTTKSGSSSVPNAPNNAQSASTTPTDAVNISRPPSQTGELPGAELSPSGMALATPSEEAGTVRSAAARPLTPMAPTPANVAPAQDKTLTAVAEGKTASSVTQMTNAAGASGSGEATKSLIFVAADPPLMTPKPGAEGPQLSLSGIPSAKAAPLASVASAGSTPPTSSTGDEAAVSPTEFEEVRLAKNFLAQAGLSDARLIVADKPPALADFSAVWRADKSAGAVKIIPPGPNVSGISIASDLIKVDPETCKGTFTSARSSSRVGNNVVFSATLSCIEAKEQHITQYFIASRRKGGFAVFAVIGDRAVGKGVPSVSLTSKPLSKAAMQAVEDEG